MNITRRYWFDAILFVAAAALYAPALRNGFVGDDLVYFIGNEHIASFDVSTILRSGAIGADYLPLRDLSFALDYLLWGEKAFGFHLTNVILFGMTVVGVKHLFAGLSSFLTGREGEQGETAAFWAALVFTVHPNHREVVYAVYNRGALLTVLFSVLSCLLFLRFLRSGYGRWRSYAAALFCFMFAVMSREYGIILPAVLVVLVFFDARSRRAAHFIYTLPFFLVAVYFFARYREVAVAANFISPSAGLFPAFGEIISKATVALKIMLFYIVRMATSLGEFTFDDSPVLALFSLAAVAGFLFGAVRTRRRYPQVLFGLLFYLVCLFPVLNFFGTFPIVAPRYSFLPCVGLFFIITAIPIENGKKLVPAMFVAFTLIWTLSTMQKTFYWKDNIAYWEAMAARDQMHFSYLQLGYAYYDGQRYDKSVEMLQKVQPGPQEPRYHATLGKACFKMGDYECALRSLETAMTQSRDDGTIPLELAKVYKAMGNRVDAERYCEFVGNTFPSMKSEVELLSAEPQ